MGLAPGCMVQAYLGAAGLRLWAAGAGWTPTPSVAQRTEDTPGCLLEGAAPTPGSPTQRWQPTPCSRLCRHPTPAGGHRAGWAGGPQWLASGDTEDKSGGVSLVRATLQEAPRPKLLGERGGGDRLDKAWASLSFPRVTARPLGIGLDLLGSETTRRVRTEIKIR